VEVAMSPSIEVDSAVFDLLKAEAEPFVDTSPNLVLRRLLGLDAPSTRRRTETPMTPRPVRGSETLAKTKKPRSGKGAPSKRARAATGTLLPEDRYERPLLKALVDAGGQAPYREVVELVGRELKDALMPADFETLNSGSVRWQSRLQFVRLRLIERGYLDKNSPRGVWGVTEAGRQELLKGAVQ
jgi:hypothetical protein